MPNGWREAWFQLELRDAAEPVGHQRGNFNTGQVHAQAPMYAAAERPAALPQNLPVVGRRYLVAAVFSARGFLGEPHHTAAPGS
jgi:hypothetical protein